MIKTFLITVAFIAAVYIAFRVEEWYYKRKTNRFWDEYMKRQRGEM